MRRGVEVVIGKSDIPNAGWGAFCKKALSKGDFIGEYVGEMISQEEADRRGQLYDIQNHSSLFMLTTDIALDADRKGNLLRYLNHSSTPNAIPRTVCVDGDNRIAFFACRDIPAQTELTFDYGYNLSVDNEFVLMSGKAVPWMDYKGGGESSHQGNDREELDNTTSTNRGRKKTAPKRKSRD